MVTQMGSQGKVPARVNSGTYTGDGNDNQSIPHGLGVVPKIIFISQESWMGVLFVQYGGDQYQLGYVYSGPGYNITDATVPDATNFYARKSGTYHTNNSGRVYNWIAIG